MDDSMCVHLDSSHRELVQRVKEVAVNDDGIYFGSLTQHLFCALHLQLLADGLNHTHTACIRFLNLKPRLGGRFDLDKPSPASANDVSERLARHLHSSSAWICSPFEGFHGGVHLGPITEHL
jgi:hypothetical protein